MIFKSIQYCAVFAGAIFLSSCNGSTEHAENTQSEVDSTRGIVMENMDTTVRPADDFFLFVNGTWVDKTEIPAEEGRWGSFNELQEYNNDELLKVLTNASKNTEQYPEGSDEAKAAKFYKIGMDSLHAEELGMKPAEPFLKKIEDINSKNEIQKVLADFHSKTLEGFFSFFVDQDMKKSDEITAYLYQGGLGLPDRDYYTKQDDKSKEIRKEYLKFIGNMFKLMGTDSTQAKADAKTVLDIETQLAKTSMTMVEQRDIPKLYNKMSLTDVNKISPAIDWKAYLADLGLTSLDTIIVSQPEFFKELSKVINKQPLDNLKTYMKWHVIADFAPYLSHDFVQESFNFNSTVLSGTTEMKPRWKRVMSTTNKSIGEALGKLYVADAFPPEAKATAKEMVENIRLVFKDRIRNLDWMSDSTKNEALKKLDAFRVKIGYPDKWKEYKGLELQDSYAGSVVSAKAFEFKKDLDKIGKPVDTTEWGMTPPTVNAYYNPAMNEIVFPAGILQPPFYDYKADPAVNYGGIGAVIGHELTHGFDDQGRQFDAKGNLKDWWTEEDATRFKARAQKVVDQFNKLEVLDSVYINGELTLGENIADLGGLTLAYDALQKHLKEHGDPGKINGYTQEQRFFMSWAQVWRTKQREETIRKLILTDPHSPGEFRVDAPLSNLEVFYKAFNVEKGDKMWRPDSVRAKIW